MKPVPPRIKMRKGFAAFVSAAGDDSWAKLFVRTARKQATIPPIAERPMNVARMVGIRGEYRLNGSV